MWVPVGPPSSCALKIATQKMNRHLCMGAHHRALLTFEGTRYRTENILEKTHNLWINKGHYTHPRGC